MLSIWLKPIFYLIQYSKNMVGFSYTDDYGFWVNISYYTHSDPDMPAITLLPMIHLGEEAYYDEIKHEMWCHDSVYLEGCYVPAVKGLYLLHRIIGFRSKLKLQAGKRSLWRNWQKEKLSSGHDALQERVREFSCDCGECYSLQLRQVRADLHRWHALKALKTIPFWNKICFPFIILAALIAAPFLNLRTLLFEEDDSEEDPDQDEDHWLERLILPFKKFVLEDRDLFLRTVLAEEIIEDKNKGKSLCIKYGEKHMKALSETLLKDFGYELSEQRSVLAVAKNKSQDLSELDTGYGIAYDKLWNLEEKQNDTPEFWEGPFNITPKNITYENPPSPAVISRKYTAAMYDHEHGYEQNKVSVDETVISYKNAAKEAA